VNRTVENIGARRLHTVVEKIMEEISFNASEQPHSTFEITELYVKEKVKDYLGATDLKKYII
jgi:ATP-dependent HslUV protease ATP-binding subunit HslU